MLGIAYEDPVVRNSQFQHPLIDNLKIANQRRVLLPQLSVNLLILQLLKPTFLQYRSQLLGQLDIPHLPIDFLNHTFKLT